MCRLLTFPLPLLLLCATAATAAVAESSACPVRLLDVPDDAAAAGDASGEGLSLSEKGLEYLTSQPSPIYVVPALGVYRGGKSLLLNRIMNLTAPYSNGFGVGHRQSTHTRGVDVCAESVRGLGTVVWMDTEGLFSSEYSRGAYGPKIFSLALLFASSVLLNSVKVLSDQFFDFFAEEQRVARVLKGGLTDAGIPPAALLPDGLSVFWVLQQPVDYGGADASAAMDAEEDGVTTTSPDWGPLEAFLRRPGDDLRDRVTRDFVHRLHEVPIAAHDARLWDRLDATPDTDLLPEYVDAGRRLRSALLRDLPRSRPLHNRTVASQMRLYLDIVRAGGFRTELAREVFEESEMGVICGSFADRVTNITGSFPVPSLKLRRAFMKARSEVEPRADALVETYHLDRGWKVRLQRCLGEREGGLRKENGERAMVRWRAEVDDASEQRSCFFLGDLSDLLTEFGKVYQEEFGPPEREQAGEYARRLQRTRLIECVRLRDVLLPFSPLLVWLFCRAYLCRGTPSSLGMMVFHGVILLGSYSFLQMTKQLPPYLDMDFAILKENTELVDWILYLPPNIPWETLAYAIRTIGMALAMWKIMAYLARMFRPAGTGREVHQLINLELKVNKLRKVSDATVKYEILAVALDASSSIDRDDAKSAYRSLLKGMAYACELGDEELAQFGVTAGFTKVVVTLMRERWILPSGDWGVGGKVKNHRLDEFVKSRDLQKLLGEMIHVMGLLSKR